MPPVAFDPTKVGVESIMTIRSLIHDTKADRVLLQDEEIKWQLTRRGFTTGLEDPDTNPQAVYLAAAECAELIQAKFASESEIAITAVGPVKSAAAGEFARLARSLREKGSADAAPKFANPGEYETTFVAGVDPEPDLE